MVISVSKNHKWPIKINFAADPIDLSNRAAQHAVVFWSSNSNRIVTKEKVMSESARFFINHSHFLLDNIKVQDESEGILQTYNEQRSTVNKNLVHAAIEIHAQRIAMCMGNIL